MNLDSSASRVSLRNVLAGIGSGVAGGIFLIGFLMLGSAWYHHSVWLVANLFSTSIYGSDGYVDRFATGSVPGIAIILVVYGLAGAFWGMLFRDRKPRFSLFIGAICGAITYFVLFDIFCRRVNPVLWLYAPVRELEFANILWGIMIARSPLLARRISEATRPLQADAVEVSSGELIL